MSQDEAECSPHSGCSSTPPYLLHCGTILMFFSSFTQENVVHASTLPHPTPLNHSIISTFLSCLPYSTHTHTYYLASFQFKKKKTSPWSGLWNGATLPAFQGVMKRNPACSIDFRGEANKKGKTAKPLRLAASRRRECGGKECKGSQHATFTI